MKQQVTKYKRWLQWRKRLVSVPAAMLFFVLSAQAQTDAILPPMGGGGGDKFVARCPQGQFLTGLKLRTGDWVDAIRPLCVTAYGPADVGPIESSPLDVVIPPHMFGGNGGDLRQLICLSDTPIVTGMSVYAEGITVTVNSIDLFCGNAATTQRAPSKDPSAQFNGTFPYGTALRRDWSQSEDTQRCPTSLVAVGINGRSGEWLNAVGLICGVPTLTEVVKAVGRTKLPPGTTPNPPRPICNLAQEARARNNPAAAGLEAQCAAERAALGLDGLAAKGAAMANADQAIAEARDLQPAGPARRGFHIGIAASEGQTAPGPGKDRIRDALPPAEQGGFNTALTFSLLRNRKRIADMAPTGEAIANQDPLAAELRGQQREGPARRGFDIGMAAAEGQTELVPDIQSVRNTLSPDETKGFDTAIAFSLARNKEKIADSASNLAPRGKAIANKDPLTAELRKQQPDGPVRQGFDIGMAAAEGQTAPGPGKQKIRDSLSPGEQQGFDVAVAFSLERNRNADLAAVGAVIASKDRIAAVIRKGENNVFYWLGFDIASGIFGDPALGARGNTATGPGSLRIRDSLSAAGQRGFNASVKLHLSRNYKR
jgi:hypothetical protein